MNIDINKLVEDVEECYSYYSRWKDEALIKLGENCVKFSKLTEEEEIKAIRDANYYSSGCKAVQDVAEKIRKNLNKYLIKEEEK